MLYSMCQRFVIILTAIFLVACSASQMPVKPAITKTFEMVSSEFKQPQTPTITLFPTIDPLTPSAVAQFFATSEAKFATKEAESLIPQSTPTVYFEYCQGQKDVTSDGKWAICNKYADSVVFINPSNQTWQFSYKSFYGQEVSESCTELLYSTSDGVYIYFALPDGCMMTEPWFPGAIGVFRINLTNGKVDNVLGESYNFQNYSGHTYNVSISPTGRRMAYIVSDQMPISLNILDLKTGENHSLPLDSKYFNGGLFEWSKDGTKLALVLASKSKDEYDDALISFAFLDLLKTDSMISFIHEKEFTWINAQIEVTESGVRVDVYGETPLFYDLKTGVVSKVVD